MLRLLLCCCCCTLLLMVCVCAALYDWCCWCCCCCSSCCSIFLLYYQKNAEVILLLRTENAHPNISWVAPFWTARFLCTYTHHRWLYCTTGRIFDSIKFTSEEKSCISTCKLVWRGWSLAEPFARLFASHRP